MVRNSHFANAVASNFAAADGRVIGLPPPAGRTSLRAGVSAVLQVWTQAPVFGDTTAAWEPGSGVRTSQPLLAFSETRATLRSTAPSPAVGKPVTTAQEPSPATPSSEVTAQPSGVTGWPARPSAA